MSCECSDSSANALPVRRQYRNAQEAREAALTRLGKSRQSVAAFKPIPLTVRSPIDITQKPKTMNWAYGITTVPSRINEYFPRTLESLRRAGFNSPRLFVDGAKSSAEYERFGLDDVTVRWPGVRTVGNWQLSMLELYIRNPSANLYAIFQDDFVTYRNLREYLERAPMPSQGYLNLYTFPSNQQLATGQGWYKSNQQGKGAVALVFTRLGVQTLFQQRSFIEKVCDPGRGHKSIDGAIVTAMSAAGWTEYVHNPSLVQHIGDASSMRNPPHLKATSFRGEEFDALELLA